MVQREYRTTGPRVQEPDKPARMEYRKGMIDSITSMHMAMEQAQLMQQVQTSVMASAIDLAEVQGDAVAALINEAVTDPMLGQNVNILA